MTTSGLRGVAAQHVDGWRPVALGTILREVDVRAADAGELAAPVLSLTKNYGLIPQSERFEHRIARTDVSDYKVVRQGMLVYNPYVIWEGAVHVLHAPAVGLVSPVYLTFEVGEGIDPHFLDLVIRSPAMLSEYSRLSSGVVQRRRSIKKPGFLGIELELPPESEQERIAHVVGTAGTVRRSSAGVLSAARRLLQSLMTHVFTYGAADIQRMTEVRVVESAAGLVPEHWTLAPVAAGLREAQYGLSKRGEAAGRVAMFRMNGLRGGRMQTSNLQYVDVDDQTLARFRLNPGDVVFNRTNSFELVGKTAIFDLPGDFVFASYLVRLRTERAKLLPEFLNYYLNWDVAQARMRTLASRGVSQSNISASKLKSFEIPLPPVNEQARIVEILDAAAAKVRAEEARSAADLSIFTAMLAELTGRERPEDASSRG